MKRGTDSVELNNNDCQKSISFVLRKNKGGKVNKRLYESKKSGILLFSYCLEIIRTFNKWLRLFLSQGDVC